MAKLPHLQPPPADYATWDLKTKEVDPATLYRISGHASGEPFFSRAADKRFDDPNPTATARYGVCYLGQRLSGAFAETAYFRPSWTAFQADRGRHFSVIVDGVSD